ncbi:MAG: molybdenum cofactor biosynthesis protein MoaE [Thermococci archaeon]|nr:molybdenum cofactor biosynthesis protein MoaE [Thermococci archaeon]
MERIMILTEEFDLEEAVKLVSSRNAGGYVIFLGKVRDDGDNRRVLKLIYESYDEMALREMRRIREEALKKFPVVDVLIWHRKGEVPVGGATMLVIAAGAHRREAFDACEWIVNEVKRTVPIWKREVTTDGTFWVEGDRRVPTG